MRVRSSLLAFLATLALLCLAPPAAGEAMETTEVGSDVCLECHDAAEMNLHNVHFRIQEFEVRGRSVGCESCHGNGSLHSEPDWSLVPPRVPEPVRELVRRCLAKDPFDRVPSMTNARKLLEVSRESGFADGER